MTILYSQSGTAIDGNATTKALNWVEAPSRTTPVLHRDAITAADRLSAPAAPTLADVATGGSLAFNTTYYFAVAAHNRWGVTTTTTPVSQLTANDAVNTHVIQATVAAVTGADGYDVFLSTDAAPKWVARVTEAQRAAGVVVTAVGTVTTTGGTAGKIDVCVVGTGIQTSNAVFANNTAYTPASVTGIDCTGYKYVHFDLKLALTDARSAPSLNVIPFFKNALSTSDWHAGTLQTVSVLNGTGTTLEQSLDLEVDGHAAVVLLVSNIAGQGAAMSAWASKS